MQLAKGRRRDGGKGSVPPVGLDVQPTSSSCGSWGACREPLLNSPPAALTASLCVSGRPCSGGAGERNTQGQQLLKSREHFSASPVAGLARGAVSAV